MGPYNPEEDPIMTFTRIAIASTLALLVAAPACAVKSNADDNTGTTEDQLVADHDDSEGEDESNESDEEEALSGEAAATADAGVDPSATADAHMDKVRTNPGIWFKPAGCIVTTVDKAAHRATHVFTNCTAPSGRVLNGTVISTWTFETGKITVTHDTEPGFTVNKATVDRKVVVTYSKNGSVFTRNRQVTLTGQTAGGKDINRTASWTMTYDAAAKCVTRQGSATTTIGSREHTTSIDGYKRCGIGTFGCPDSGTITLERKKGVGGAEKDVKVVIEFLGGRQMRITMPSGRVVNRALVCRVVGG